MDRSFTLRRLWGFSLLLGSLFANPAIAEDAAPHSKEPTEPAKLPTTPAKPLESKLQPSPAADASKAPADVPAAAEGNVYRPISLIAMESENSAPVTPNRWILSRTELPDGTTNERTATGDDAAKDTPASACFEAYTDKQSLLQALGLSDDRVTVIPPGLLWLPPLANQREPRTYAKFTNAVDQSTIDTAIGGEFGLFRVHPAESYNEGFQLDGFAAVFTRFDDRRRMVANDFRAGVPLTYASGPWQAKLAYEHLSSHLGDEYMQATGARQVAYVRDEVVFGLARLFWEQLRLYGQAGYAFHTSPIIGGKRDRFDWGLEWSRRCPTGWKGQPFAAFDMDLRADQDYNANTTVQLGWQWTNMGYLSGRIALEYYNGRSPFGQFAQLNNDWVGVAFLYDW